MHNSFYIRASVLVLVVGSVSAQSFPVPKAAIPTVGAENVVPFGAKSGAKQWINQRYQSLVKAKQLGNSSSLVIRDLAFAPYLVSPEVRHFDSIEIVIGQTKATTLVSKFATNLAGNVKTVLKATNYDWHVKGNRWNRIGLDMPYNYLPAAFGGNLVIQITVTGAHSPSGRGFRSKLRAQRVTANNWAGTPPTTGTYSQYMALILEVVVGMNDLGTFGIGCPGASTVTPKLSFQGSAKLGQSFSINLASAPTSRPLFLVIGSSRFEPAVDLSSLSSPGCKLYPKLDFLLGTATSRLGAHSIKLPVPNNRSLVGTRLYSQYFIFDKSKFSSTNYGRILIGN